jgi:hypothetical protein
MNEMNDLKIPASETDRRKFLVSAGQFATLVPPVMTLLLSTTMNSPAIAQSGAAAKGNNGVGNGLDGQPPGNPPINDGVGTGKGDPGNKGGANK